MLEQQTTEDCEIVRAVQLQREIVCSTTTMSNKDHQLTARRFKSIMISQYTIKLFKLFYSTSKPIWGTSQLIVSIAIS